MNSELGRTGTDWAGLNWSWTVEAGLESKDGEGPVGLSGIICRDLETGRPTSFQKRFKLLFSVWVVGSVCNGVKHVYLCIGWGTPPSLPFGS